MADENYDQLVADTRRRFAATVAEVIAEYKEQGRTGDVAEMTEEVSRRSGIDDEDMMSLVLDDAVNKVIAEQLSYGTIVKTGKPGSTEVHYKAVDKKQS